MSFLGIQVRTRQVAESVEGLKDVLVPTPIDIQQIVAFLSNPQNMETDTFSYHCAATDWLLAEVAASPQASWVKAMDSNFVEAARDVAAFLDSETEIDTTTANLRRHLAQWRGDLDPSVHPLSELGRVMSGSVGNYLEYRGPVMQLTLHDVLEGITHEEIVREWNALDARHTKMLMGLAMTSIGAIAQAAFWATRASGAHLDRELSRLFQAKGNREALRGQLANLLIAGRMAAWGLAVEFIPESHVKTPDWSASNGSASIWVESTSVARKAEGVNNKAETQRAIADAWNAKCQKFDLATSPGVIAIDMSGLFVDREFGAILRRDATLMPKVDMPLPAGAKRTCGIYVTRNDIEMMARESENRDFMALMSSALRSKAAKERGIKGIYTYHGQEILVDTIHDSISMPQRGVLAWSGDTDDPEFPLVVALCNPPFPNAVPNGTVAPIFLHLV